MKSRQSDKSNQTKMSENKSIHQSDKKSIKTVGGRSLQESIKRSQHNISSRSHNISTNHSENKPKPGEVKFDMIKSDDIKIKDNPSSNMSN